MALNIEWSCDTLTDAQFNYCIKQAPICAILHPHVCKRLTDEQFDYCIRKEPIAALVSGSASIQSRLTDIQLDECLKQQSNPDLFGTHPRMNPYQKAWFKNKQ
jgi:hypothetical protein